MPDPIQIFIAYSRRDSDLLEELRTHLTPLSRSGRVKVWYDGELAPGSVWEDAIKNNLHSSEIILLLVSASAIASDYFYEKEMGDALERHAQSAAHVVPFILRPCDWSATPLAKLQAIPKNGLAVTSWANRDDAFADAVISIRKLVELIERKRSKPQVKARVINDPLAGEMVLVQGGTFMMGENGIAEPVHSVTLSDFYIGKYPVTQRQWREVMGNNPSYFKGCDDCPVESVSWDDVQVFIKRLNKKSGHIFRLPTEAEWEYAAKGGALSRNFRYSGSNDLDEVAWHKIEPKDGDQGGKKRKKEKKKKIGKGVATHPVGAKAPNELGICDMNGNIWEWCEDDLHNNYEGAPIDGGAWIDDPRNSDRVLRGGGWRTSSPKLFRTTYRGKGRRANECSKTIGFRLVLQL